MGRQRATDVSWCVLGSVEVLHAYPQIWKAVCSQLEMAPAVVKPSFYWHSELKRLMDDPSPP